VLPLATLVVRPSGFRVVDIPLLPLDASTKQDHEDVAVASEVDAIARPKSIRYSSTPSPTPFAFERLPCSIRASATVIRAAAVDSS
jgi:hypothetical protein